MAAGTKEQHRRLCRQPPARTRLSGAKRGGCLSPCTGSRRSPSWPPWRGQSRPTIPVRGCCPTHDGQVVHSGREVLKRLVAQVASPVRWDLYMGGDGRIWASPGLLEMPPAGTLKPSIAKRQSQGRRPLRSHTPTSCRRRWTSSKARRAGNLADLRQPMAARRLARQGAIHPPDDIVTDSILLTRSTVSTVKNLRDGFR